MGLITVRSMAGYDQSWHVALGDKTASSARKILSHLFALFPTKSVLDLGCGHGHWLAVARALGVERSTGVDGEWARPDALLFPAGDFRCCDLEACIELNARFDLAMSLEVGEHLKPAAAPTLVENLVRHSDLVLFSAAIPMQGGFQHINERWQSYWVTLFAAAGYRHFDIVRPLVWDDESVHSWYRQNAFVFVRNSRADLIRVAEAEMIRLARDRLPIDLVHPEHYGPISSYQLINLRALLPKLPGALWKAIARRAGLSSR
jgi:SAM-dependent methyltransferase